MSITEFLSYVIEDKAHWALLIAAAMALWGYLFRTIKHVATNRGDKALLLRLSRIAQNPYKSLSKKILTALHRLIRP